MAWIRALPFEHEAHHRVLVDHVHAAVQADVRLGLLAPRAAVLVAALPRGNQSVASGVVIRRGLTVRQTALFVREIIDATEPAAREAVLAHWVDGRRADRRRRGGCARPVHGITETIARDVTSIQRSAGRLQACLTTTPLAAMGPAKDMLGEGLGNLDRVLRALSHPIAGVLAKESIA